MCLVEFDDGFRAARASNGDFLFPAIVFNFKLKTRNNSYQSVIGEVQNNISKVRFV